MNIDIKYKDHFKLYILLKDKLAFEAALHLHEIKFYIDLETQAITANRIRYFLLDKDREKIDEILRDAEVIATTETINISDYRDEKKYFKFYIIVAGIVLGVLLLATLFENLP